MQISKGVVQMTAIDDYEYLGFKLVTLVKEHKKEGINKARYTMFEQLLYLLKPWSGVNGGEMANMSAETVKLQWKKTPPCTISHPSQTPQAIELGTYKSGEQFGPDVCKEKTWIIYHKFANGWKSVSYTHLTLPTILLV